MSCPALSIASRPKYPFNRTLRETLPHTAALRNISQLMVKRLIQKVLKHLRGKSAPEAKHAPHAHTSAKPTVSRTPSAPVLPIKAGSEKSGAEEFHPRRQATSHRHHDGAASAPARHEAKPASAHRPAAPHGQRHERPERHERHERRPAAPKPAHQHAPAAALPSIDELAVKAKAAHGDWTIALAPVEPSEGKTRFQDLDLPGEILHAIADLGFKYCTPIQAQVLPHTLAGRDAFGKAQTGTGKTAAFLITMLNQFLRNPGRGDRKPGTPRALILAPTRELCIQIHKDATALMPYSGLTVAAVFGGMDYEKQKRQLRGQVVDIVAATPGRLLDFKKRGDLDLSQVEILVIDEADRMLDMGFIPDVRTIVHSTPAKDRRQTLFFSATMTPDVQRLAAQWTREPVSIEIEPEQVATDTVQQMVYIVTTDQKFALLYNLLQRENAQRVIVFVNRRDHAEQLLARLQAYHINGALLSGAVPQEKRVRVLEQFREGKIRVMVATDVAGRGIHVDSVSHVVNFNLPFDAEDYVHRIGRTGRAGNLGTSISFADEDDSFYIPAIEKYLGNALACTHPEDEWLVLPPPPEGSVDPGPGSRPQRRPYAGRGGPRRRGGPGGGGGRGRPSGRR